jgi:hypothetical protein
VRSFRRSLSDILNPLARSGFVLDTILEPRPVAGFERLDPDAYERLNREPGFLCVRARKA